jgi:hypothetical protein
MVKNSMFRAAAVSGAAVIEDDSFVALLKQFLNSIGGGFPAVGPAAFEIGFTVNPIVVRTGKYKVVGQWSIEIRKPYGLCFRRRKNICEVRVGHFTSPNAGMKAALDTARSVLATG